MQSTSVFFYFDEVDGHGWHFADHDTSQSVGHGEVSLEELELNCVARELEDFNFAGSDSRGDCVDGVMEILV